MAAQCTEKQFWDWFVRHARQLRNPSGRSYEQLTDELLDILQGYHEGLSFEIGSDEIEELVITAYGDTDHFDAIEKLVSQAPPITGWKVTAFKPPMEGDFRLEMDDVLIDTAHTFFVPLESLSAPDDVGLRVYLDGFDPARDESYMCALSTALQTILGEKSFAYDVQHIEIEPLPGDTAGLIPISGIPDYIKWKKEQRILN